MHRQFVESSMLRSVGYASDKKILELEFQHGGIYHYLDVDEETWRELIAAESLGRYFLNYIQDQYEEYRVR